LQEKGEKLGDIPGGKPEGTGKAFFEKSKKQWFHQGLPIESTGKEQ